MYRNLLICRIPENEFITQFEPKEVEVHSISSIPSSAKKVYLLQYNEDINITLPITHLSFDHFKKGNSRKLGKPQQYKPTVDIYPSSLTYLSLGINFNNDSLNHLPSSLTYLSINENSEFNMPIDNLPPSLTHLVMNNDFNQRIDTLPPSLTHLTLGSNFDHPLTKLPPNLLYLSMKYSKFSSELILPSSINHLVLPSGFNYFLDFSHTALIHLECGTKFNQPLDSLPSTLKGKLFSILV